MNIVNTSKKQPTVSRFVPLANRKVLAKCPRAKTDPVTMQTPWKRLYKRAFVKKETL
jgi:hypothetical protein